jgi:hypothetical protein
MIEVLDKVDLDELRCGNPDCPHQDHPQIHFHPRCHPDASLEIFYEKASSHLVIECANCEEEVVRIRVTGKVEPEANGSEWLLPS